MDEEIDRILRRAELKCILRGIWRFSPIILFLITSWALVIWFFATVT